MIQGVGMLVQIGIIVTMAVLVYAIIQVVNVVREERQYLMWRMQNRNPDTEQGNDDVSV